MNETTLAGTGLSEDVQHLVIDQISAGVEDLQLVVKQLGGKGGSIAIRDEDFPILREVAMAVANLAGGMVFHAWAPAAIASLVVLLYTFRKNGIVLTPTQGALVRELKRRPAGLTAEEAASILKLSIEDTIKDLQSLEVIPRNDGVVVRLTSVDKLGKWRVGGV